MRIFQIVRNGQRVARLFVNCKVGSQEISEVLVSAAAAFRVAARWEKIDGKKYCGMADYEGTSMYGAHVQIYEVEEEGATDD